MNEQQVIDDASVLWACRATDAAVAQGSVDDALRYLSLAVNRWHARRFARMIDATQAALRAEHGT